MSQVCRLCLSSKMLFDLFEFNGDKYLPMKIVSCINVEVCSNDNLPSMICKSCKDMINKFYVFKQQCLKINSKLHKRLNHFRNESNVISEISSKEENKSYILNQIDKTIFPNQLSITENSLIRIDSSKNKSKVDCKMETKDVDVKKYQCEICGRVFKMKSGLDNHLITHSGMKRHACNLCPKKFCRAENLTVHTLSHSGIKPYICEICGKLSSRRQDLIRHMKIHSDNRDYACPRCNRYFKRSSDISSHMRTHTGMRPYNCNRCPKTYTSHSGLRKHKAHCK